MVDASKDRVVQLHISTGVHTGSSPVLTTIETILCNMYHFSVHMS